MNVRTICCLLVAGVSLVGVGCKSSDPKAAAISRAKGVPATVPAVDKAPAAFQVDLLDLAMDCATAIPVEPHIKDRCRCQEAVVEACLEINAFTQAQSFAEQVKDWRRGACYADLAIYLSRHNGAADASKYLEKAGLISNADGLESWRRDTIRQKMAQAYIWLGEDPQATTIESGLSAADVGKVAGVRAARSDDAVFEAQFKILSDLAANRDLDTASSGLESSLSLYDHFYGDSDRRALIEKMMREGWRKVPVFRQIDLALKLCDAALDHKDLAHAMALVDEAETIKNGAKWPIEYETPLTARLAAYRYRAGDLNKAGASLSAALAKEIADKLKEWIKAGKFTLTEAVAPLPGIESGVKFRALRERI